MSLLVLAVVALTVAGTCGAGTTSRLRGLARGTRDVPVARPVREGGRDRPARAGRASVASPVDESRDPARPAPGGARGPVARTDVLGRRGPSSRTAAVSRRRDEAVEIDAALVLALVEAALTTGSAIPTALTAVGRAIDGPSGAALERAGSALVLGATWSTAWSGAPAATRPVCDALESAWRAGAPPVPGLRARAERLRRERRRAVRTAAARLAVHLVLPLGACFLPAFVLVGLVPIVLSLTDGLLLLP